MWRRDFSVLSLPFPILGSQSNTARCRTEIAPGSMIHMLILIGCWLLPSRWLSAHRTSHLPNYPEVRTVEDFRGSSDGKESACNAGGLGPIPGSGRCPAEGNGYPLHYSYLENLMDREAWWATVYAIAESDMIEQLSMHTRKLITVSSQTWQFQ